jgi:patatin-related protein
MPQAKVPDPDPRIEVRLGLVLYGGISLAVYMYGVVMEFWRLVRASQGKEVNAYTSILQGAAASAIVDIISGTSAGGINGVLLAKALATGSNLGALKGFWVDHADFEQLLRRPSEPTPRSLLSPDFFEEQLTDALAQMDRLGTGQALVPIMDLFVSGTRLTGKVSEFLDSLGQTVQSLEYRKVFHLKFRQKGYNLEDPDLGYDQNDFEAKSNRMLVEVSRATSAFPGAFEPPLVSRRSDNAMLFAPGDPDATYFSDGGILHNKPFTEAISTIFTRMADRPVRRWLLSVEPAPELYTTWRTLERNPDVVEVLSKAVLSIPAYQSIVADLAELRDHNDRVRGVNDLLRRIEVIIDAQFRDVIDQSSPEEFREFLSRQVLYIAYQSLNMNAVIDDTITAIMHGATLTEADRSYVENGIRSFATSVRSTSNVAGFLDAFDIPYRLRRLYYLIDYLDTFAAPLSKDVQESVRTAHRMLWAQFDQIRTLVWNLFEGKSDIAERIRGLHGEGGNDLSRAILALMPDMQVAIRDRLGLIRAASLSICQELDTMIGDLKRRLPQIAVPPHAFVTVFERYEVRDMFILPLEVLTNLGERDEVKFIRISPEAAVYIQKPADQKLTGTNLGHFGGFLSPAWRTNDILWGRLDAAEVIVRVLREGEDFDALTPDVRAAQEEIVREEQPPGWTPATDYKTFLERDYTVGAERLSDLPADYRANLGLRTSQIVRNMLRRLGMADALSDLLRVCFSRAGTALGVALGVVRWPVIAIWGRDVTARKFATLLMFFLFGWSVLSFVASLFNLIPMTGRLMVWELAFALPFCLWILALEGRWGLAVIIALAIGGFIAWRWTLGRV